jgi:hypothetical protein
MVGLPKPYLCCGRWVKAGDTQALYFYLEFYPQHVQLVNLYNTNKPATFLVNNIKNVSFGE